MFLSAGCRGISLWVAVRNVLKQGGIAEREPPSGPFCLTSTQPSSPSFRVRSNWSGKIVYLKLVGRTGPPAALFAQQCPPEQLSTRGRHPGALTAHWVKIRQKEAAPKVVGKLPYLGYESTRVHQPPLAWSLSQIKLTKQATTTSNVPLRTYSTVRSSVRVRVPSCGVHTYYSYVTYCNYVRSVRTE